MTRLSAFAVALAATTIVGSASLAALAAQDVVPPAASAGQTQAGKDFAKLSDEGQRAMQDLHLARLALFEGDTAQAKTLVGDARDKLGTARTNEGAFMKAEADIRPPAGMKPRAAAPAPAPAPAPADAAKTADAAKDGGAKPAAQPVAWLPVGGQVMVDESFQPTPENQKAVASADAHMKAGEKAQAQEVLKPTGIDVDYAMALAPLDATSAAVDKAATLIDGGKFYEANLALKSAEDAIVIDVVDVTATPATADAGPAAAPPPAPMPAPAPDAAKHAQAAPAPAAPAPVPQPAPAPQKG